MLVVTTAAVFRALAGPKLGLAHCCDALPIGASFLGIEGRVRPAV